MQICDEIDNIFKESKQTYGSPRIHKILLNKGFQVSENTVAKYMRDLKIDARLKKKFKIKTTDSDHTDPIADRIFKVEDSAPEKPNEVLAGDITYLKVGSTFYYLSIVMDLYNREILGWSVNKNLTVIGPLKALKVALKNCSPKTKIIFHSDRGSQYASQVFRDFIENKNVIPSMSRKGNCYDNAYVESWFKSFKSECFYRKNIKSESDLRALVFNYIECWYNKKRLHSSLDYMSPIEYRTKQLAA